MKDLSGPLGVARRFLDYGSLKRVVGVNQVAKISEA